MRKTIVPYLQNREISWLRFNERVLEEAEAPEVPLLEKLKFISIFTSNLDEFFMVRVGSLHDLGELKKELHDPKTGWTPKEQISEILAMLPAMYAKRDSLYAAVTDGLKACGIEHVSMSELDREALRSVRHFYEESIEPILSPQIVDPHHPFPFLENKKKYIFCELESEKRKMFGLIPVRMSFPAYFILPGEPFRYVLTEEILSYWADELFPGFQLTTRQVIAITRNFDMTDTLETKDEFEDYKEYMKLMLKKRKRLSPVRLEVDRPLSKTARKFLLDKLEMAEESVFLSKAPLSMQYVYDLITAMPTALRRELCYPPFVPYDRSGRAPSVTEMVRKRDMLLSYPYEDIQTFLRLLDEAAGDPNCRSIKITIYRLAKQSQVVRRLVRAAENGVEVTVFMELKARFDEQANIDYSNILYDAGCQIIYGFQDYKIHSKLLVITYRNPDGTFSHITQVGTGNYNESTARLYTDFALITAREDFGLDAADFFRNMAVGRLDGNYKHFLQSPTSFKQTIRKHLEEERAKGVNGFVFCKLNSLTDKDLCEDFVALSEAGATVQLIIRGITCLMPGVTGYTDNVTIRSVVGRYLEHARVYVFGRENPKIYIASADLMTRNTERRVEVAVPIYDEEIRQRLLTYLCVQWDDTQKGREMSAMGEYIRREGDFSSQAYFAECAEEMAQAAVQSADAPSVDADTEDQRGVRGIWEAIRKRIRGR